MKAYRRLAQRIAASRSFSWLGPHVVTPLDKLLGARMPNPTTTGTGLEVLRLTTVGRRSARPRTSPLVYLEADDGGYVVFGTNFGGRRHPGWTYNLDQEPSATVSLTGGRTVAVTARRAGPGESDRHWARLLEVWPPYEEYRKRAGHRDIRIYVLEPRG